MLPRDIGEVDVELCAAGDRRAREQLNFSVASINGVHLNGLVLFSN